MQTDMHVFHKEQWKSKEAECLLKTLSFPHSPQAFPQGFSTGTMNCGYTILVHIKRSDTIRTVSHFFADCGFYHGADFVQKLPP